MEDFEDYENYNQIPEEENFASLNDRLKITPGQEIKIDGSNESNTLVK